MRYSVFLYALLAAALFDFNTPALAKEPVGFVEGKRGAAGSQVWINRAGTRVRAVAGTPLFPGDVVRVQGQGNRVTVRVSGTKGKQTVRAGQTLKVPDVAKEGWGAAFKRYANSISWALGLTDRESSRGTYSRSGPSSDEIAEFEPLKKLEFLDTPTLLASHELGDLLVRWCGDAELVEAQVEDWAMLDVATNQLAFGSVVLEGLKESSVSEGVAGPERIFLKSPVAGQPDQTFDLEWVSLSVIPKPEGLPDFAQQTLQEKGLWGSWLIDFALQEEDKRYNLIALNLLRQGVDEHWSIAHKLQAVTTCPSDRVQN